MSNYQYGEAWTVNMIIITDHQKQFMVNSVSFDAFSSSEQIKTHKHTPVSIWDSRIDDDEDCY